MPQSKVVALALRPDETTSYLLRMFSDGDVNLKPLDEDYPEIPWFKSCVVSNPVMATRVTVKGATGLEKQGTFGSECRLFNHLRYCRSNTSV